MTKEASVVVLIGAARDAHQRVVGALGGDDVDVLSVPTPQSALEWLGRLEDLHHVEAAERIVRFGDIDVCALSRQVRCADAVLRCTEREVRILMTLFDDPIRARSHDDLLEAGWGGTERLSPALVRAAAVRLRRKLAAAGSSVRIDAVRGFGFLAAVEERS